MRTHNFARRLAALAWCAALLLPPMAPLAYSTDPADRIVIQIGAPAVWSMGQAHYLLTRIYQENLKLNTRMPSDEALDPNAVNATRIQVIKSLFEVQAQFDQKLGLENRAKLREYERRLTDRAAARTELIAVTARIQVLDEDLARLKKDLAGKQVLFEQTKNGSAALPSAANGSPEDANRLEREIAVLKKESELKETQRSELASRKAALETAAARDVEVSGLTSVDPGNASSGLPDFNVLGDYLKEAIGRPVSPRLAATIALDNFIGMQYEIIAKQLTLLRDEVGRDMRIIFLELPASIYSVAKRGDNYVAQVQWEVQNYAESDREEDELLIYDSQDNDHQNQPPSPCGQRKYDVVEQLRKARLKIKPEDCPESSPAGEQAQKPVNRPEACGADGGAWEAPLCWKNADPAYLRALDIIPRQSSLIVNDVQATTRQKNLLGLLKLVTGFGLQINYQRQTELYEQFLQQETFASGFGKGSTRFGWTFGPQPGAKRIAPGVRTMYAVLVVPQKTKALRLKAMGIAYHREKAPNYAADAKQIVQEPISFDVIVPGSAASSWRADHVNYTSANAGEPVTVTIHGHGFSSQTSVLVDGVALKNVHSIGNSPTSNATAEEAGPEQTHGQFEVVNSSAIAMKFSMGGKNYVGTPIITIVAPEKTAAINFFKMEKVNDKEDITLHNYSLLGPMFIDKFRLEKRLHPVRIDGTPDHENFVQAKLKGEGLRRNATVWVQNRQLKFKDCRGKLEDCIKTPPEEFVTQTDTREYFLYFRKPESEKWQIRFRQKTGRGFEAEEFEHQAKSPSRDGTVEVCGYTPNALEHQATVELRFWTKEEPTDVGLIPPGPRIEDLIQESNHPGQETWRGKVVLGYENRGSHYVEKDQISVTLKRGIGGAQKIRTFNLDLPVNPEIGSVAISAPPIPDDLGSVINIEGVNLQNVTEVLIAGRQATVISPPNNYSLTVRLAKSTFIGEREGVKIPVTLVTKDGKSVSGIVTIKDPAAADKPKPGIKQAKRPPH